jgi:hypothetical protein
MLFYFLPSHNGCLLYHNLLRSISKMTYLERGEQRRDVFPDTIGLNAENVFPSFKVTELFISHPQSSGIEGDLTHTNDPLNCSPIGQHFGICNCFIFGEQSAI